MISFQEVAIETGYDYCCSQKVYHGHFIRIEVCEETSNHTVVYTEFGCGALYCCSITRQGSIAVPRGYDSLCVCCKVCGLSSFRVSGVQTRQWVLEVCY